jgi:hypothetical protein
VASSRTPGASASPARRVLLAAATAVLAAIAGVPLDLAAAAASQARSAPLVLPAPPSDSGLAALAMAGTGRHEFGTGRSAASQPPADHPCPLPAAARFVSSPPPGGPPDWLLRTNQAELSSARDPHIRHSADAHRRRALRLPTTSPSGDTRPTRRDPRPDPAAVLRVPGRDPPSAA